LRVLLVPEHRTRRVEHHGEIRGTLFPDEFLQHGREAVDGARRKPLGVAQPADREVRAKELGRAVDEVQGVHAGSRILTGRAAAAVSG
jgi:hypothetical protein